MGKAGKSKGKNTGSKVLNTKLKELPWKETKTKGKGSSAPKDSAKSSKGGGQWVWVEEKPSKPAGKGKGSNDRGASKGKSKGHSKGKGGRKGKGKRRAAPLNSEFWENKIEDENRKELGDIAYPGVVHRYNIQQGWGLIKPDNLKGLPAQVQKKLDEAEKKAEDAGKELKDKGLLYFRKPDVNHEEGFKLGSDVSVTFRVYVDEKGAGACDVSKA
eukprot:TRINITY_DN94754_c0_g1_i1.p1 TRINITY_DN94754_c0_g1~~TRINITY_DN94754_c0_g1_i1.p1  ORF type:complete len:215 (-),score=57.18 TRINITY_DN94754_c0_g1_i1:101-745(-)